MVKSLELGLLWRPLRAAAATVVIIAATVVTVTAGVHSCLQRPGWERPQRCLAGSAWLMLGSHWAWPPGPEQLSPPSSACRLQRWPQEEVVVAGGRDMDAAPPCRLSVPYLPESHSFQPGAPIPAQASETPGRAGLAYLLPVAGGGMSLFRGSAPGHPP